MWVWLVAAGAGGHSVSPVTDCWGSCRLRSQSRTRSQPRHTRPALTSVSTSRLLWLWIWDPSYAQTPTLAESGKSAIFKVKYECRLSKLFGEPRELQLYVSWTFELLSRYLFFLGWQLFSVPAEKKLKSAMKSVVQCSLQSTLELQTKVCKDFTIIEKVPTKEIWLEI